MHLNCLFLLWHLVCEKKKKKKNVCMFTHNMQWEVDYIVYIQSQFFSYLNQYFKKKKKDPGIAEYFKFRSTRHSALA